MHRAGQERNDRPQRSRVLSEEEARTTETLEEQIRSLQLRIFHVDAVREFPTVSPPEIKEERVSEECTERRGGKEDDRREDIVDERAADNERDDAGREEAEWRNCFNEGEEKEHDGAVALHTEFHESGVTETLQVIRQPEQNDPQEKEIRGEPTHVQPPCERLEQHDGCQARDE